MKALYIDQVAGNPESPHTKNGQTIKGAGVFEWNLLSALLEHGTYDAYFAPGLTEEKRQALAQEGLSADSVRRLVPVPLWGPLPIKTEDKVVLLTAGRFLNALAGIRQKLKQFNAPVCGFVHSINSPRIAFALLQQCFAGLSGADLLLCSSRAGMKTIDTYINEINGFLPLELHYPARRALVPLGVKLPSTKQTTGGTLRQKFSLETDACIALYFGRLSQTSKCDLGPLLVAFSQLLRKGKSLYLIIAGDDTQAKEAPRLQALARELDCNESLMVWANPSAEDKHLLYSEADFFVSPSDNIQETFGLTVAEAMAYGLPAVVSDWNGYRDLVKDGQNGFLIPTAFPSTVESLRLCDCTMSMLEEDLLAQSTTVDVLALSERMEQLAENPELRAHMGKTARQFVEDTCSWRAVVRRYEEIWEESLHFASSPASRPRKSGQFFDISLEKCFGHYATVKRGAEQRCFITREGREWLKQPGRLYFLCRLSTALNPQEFSHILRHIADCPGFSIKEIVASLSNGAALTAADAHWILARLFKYGLVTDQQDSPKT